MENRSKYYLHFLLVLGFIAFSYGCQKIKYADLTVSSIEFTEENHVEFIDLPMGNYEPDNPNFDVNIPSTWTGNMAQYVKHNYSYTVHYIVTNSGNKIAYGSEIDLGYFFYGGNDEFETKNLGDISPGTSTSYSHLFTSTNKELAECASAIYWNNY